MKIAIAGTGYVGLSNAVLLAQNNEVIAVDIIKEKVDMINNKVSPIVDKEIQYYLSNKKLNLVATTDVYKAYKDAEFVIISTQPEQSLLLGEERNLLKFTEQTAGELADSARSMWEDFTLPATPESARTAHGQPSPPAYARTDSYTPGFPLQFPLPGQSRKTSGYGWRTDPMGGLGDDFHIGNDLAAAQGTPVLAAADGVVRMAGSHKSYGNYLRILHADGDETLYAHMQYLFVKAGECVTAGQILGTVGETGNATGPHLHFEILHRGLRYDPAEALQNAS